jgi:hypothetical protein
MPDEVIVGLRRSYSPGRGTIRATFLFLTA